MGLHNCKSYLEVKARKSDNDNNHDSNNNKNNNADIFFSALGTKHKKLLSCIWKYNILGIMVKKHHKNTLSN